MVRDEDSVRFHVESKDYFGTLASILKFLENKPNTADYDRRILAEMASDLLYLQKNYHITKKQSDKKIASK